MNSSRAMSYALGYLYAGAYLHNGSIVVNGPRKEDLEVLAQLLKQDVHIESSECGKNHMMTIVDKKLYKKLESVGLPPTEVPDIRYIRYFLSGYFDCRGGIFCDGTRRVISVISFKNFSMAHSFACIMAENGLGMVKVGIDRRTSNYYSLRYFIKDTRKLLYFLYSNTPLYNAFQAERFDRNIKLIGGNKL